jgi:hypothetical protein
MDANKEYPQARTLTYSEFPTKFVWNKKERRWTPRKQRFSIGRLHFVPPGSGEMFYLRILLNYVKGPTSFDDIKTVNGVKYPTFKDTCFARRLVNDDSEFVHGIKEASFWGSGRYLRDLFVSLLISGQMHRPGFVWEKTWEELSDDIQHMQRRILNYRGTSLALFITINLSIYFCKLICLLRNHYRFSVDSRPVEELCFG